jgi:UDP-N-acetyl-alpha-D-quinovosamine dehydrogenase
MKVLLTGASGFVGKGCSEALGRAHCVLNAVRVRSGFQHQVIIPSIDAGTQWAEALVACDIVIHCAARVHVMNESVSDPLQAFREVNVEGTANLARQAAAAGVKRFIFLSSIKVNGEFSGLGAPFTSSDEPAPEDPYGVSKTEAEQALKDICAETGMEYVIIRPPLVYGPSVKANFLSMLKWVARGVPLPLGGIRNNKRSLVYVENLVDLIKVCIEHSAAANQTFLVSDDDDVSTRELLERVAKALGVKSRLLPIPLSWLGFAGKLLGKKDIEQRLSSSLQVDISHTKNTLDWQPRYSMEEGLAKTAAWYKESR